MSLLSFLLSLCLILKKPCRFDGEDLFLYMILFIHSDIVNKLHIISYYIIKLEGVTTLFSLAVLQDSKGKGSMRLLWKTLWWCRVGRELSQSKWKSTLSLNSRGAFIHFIKSIYTAWRFFCCFFLKSGIWKCVLITIYSASNVLLLLIFEITFPSC